MTLTLLVDPDPRRALPLEFRVFCKLRVELGGTAYWEVGPDALEGPWLCKH